MFQSGQNWQNSNCQQCPTSQNNCTECMTNYLLEPNGTCGESCPTHYFGSNKKCVSTSVRINGALQAIIAAAGQKLYGIFVGTLVLIFVSFVN